MIETMVSVLFILSFVLCGCSLDGFFEGNAPFTIFCLVVTAVCGYFICHGRE